MSTERSIFASCNADLANCDENIRELRSTQVTWLMVGGQQIFVSESQVLESSWVSEVEPLVKWCHNDTGRDVQCSPKQGLLTSLGLGARLAYFPKRVVCLLECSFTLIHWFSRGISHTNNITWELVRNADSQVLAPLYGPAVCVSASPPLALMQAQVWEPRVCFSPALDGWQALGSLDCCQ